MSTKEPLLDAFVLSSVMFEMVVEFRTEIVVYVVKGVVEVRPTVVNNLSNFESSFGKHPF